MNLGIRTFLLALLLFSAAAAYTQLVSNSRYLTLSAQLLRQWANAQPNLDSLDLPQQARERAVLYDDILQQTHIVDGMVVNRDGNRGMLDQCDSLLFSSLRFVALKKLKLGPQAANAWIGLQNAHTPEGWIRHPNCQYKGTSRDMLLGLLAALAQEPPGYEYYLSELTQYVANSGGYFSHGPLYVSYLTPGIARLIYRLAATARLDLGQLPPIIQGGYSTHELTLYAIGKGYESHLVALTVWLDMEISSRISERRPPSLMERSVSTLISPFNTNDVRHQRLEWATNHLMQIDQHNLFFRYLRLRASGALTRSVAESMLDELLAMAQFPPERLPRGCDRRADYLWQRASREYVPAAPGSPRCHREYNGIDYMWMAALLVDAIESSPNNPAVERSPQL